MKKAGCAFFGCLGILVFAVVAGVVGVLWMAAPEEGEPSTSPAEPPSAQAERLPPPAERGEARTPGAGRLRLTFRFRDAEDRRRELRCEISEADLEQEQERFGIDPAAMTAQLNRELDAYLRREAAARGVDRYFDFDVYGEGSVRWTYQDPAGVGSGNGARISEFDAWLSRNALASFQETAARRYREHGFRLDGNILKVDYETQVLEATRPLADCFQALRGLAAGRREGDRKSLPLGLFLTFFQDLRYESPPDTDSRGRSTLGYWVPLEVLARGAGDCDSKAAAFCALWRQLPARVLLILVPEHALVAVEARPGPGQASVRLGNRTYVLCEVAGPGRYPPGKTDSSGSFEYVLIEPAG